ncbi:EAL domain-containing response regulator [Pseudomonas sp. URMO17WK12:I11]|uniref:EAL domain-containing response regulator n=1 Tax=Pseudomonas sp. URMO17WK12:I11 TaxID=1283291 RepID=UPI000721EEAA|nr:EAL domain-containing response regulator [Pseudomonas sp. URMO17WK12:I11]CRL51643.1 Phytochrome-like protein cph2 [Pseudomonas sp. URMO17WK12:I11]
MSELRFLVLEDHAFQCELAVRALQRIGFCHVMRAADGGEALSLLHRHGAVDVALCDLRMIGMDGLMFLRKAREAGLVRAVVIVSDLEPGLRRVVERILVLQGLQLLGSIEKPIRFRPLKRLLDKYLALSGASIRHSPLHLAQPSEAEVRLGFERQEFRASFQPKVQLQTGESVGAEVFVRWVRDGGSVLAPSVFLPVIERCGLLDAMFAELLDQGLATQKLVQSRGRHFHLAFNLNASQMLDPELANTIRLGLQRHELSAHGLTFEMTESSLITASTASLENMVRFRMMGCGLSVEDFGVAFSSPGRLCHMPFSEIKLDAGLTRNMVQENRYRAVINSTLKLARDLDMSVVAKGIETEEQLNCLRAMGCEIGQGYYFARPMSSVELVAWLFDKGQSVRWQA